MKKITSIICFLSVIVIFCPQLHADVPFEVTDTEDRSVVGELTQLDDKQITIHSENFPLNSVLKIRNTQRHPYQIKTNTSQSASRNQRSYQPPRNTNEQRLAASLNARSQQPSPANKNILPYPSPVSVLELHDTSVLVAASLRIEGAKAFFRLLDVYQGYSAEALKKMPEQSLPLDKIASVRLTVNRLEDVLNASDDWKRLTAQNTEQKSDQLGDQLVTGPVGAFDIYAGILKEINAEAVAFTTDGETLPVPRRKVFGLLLHQTQNDSQNLPKPKQSATAIISFWTGTTLAVQNVELKDNNTSKDIHWTALCGLSGAAPTDAVQEIAFIQRNVFYLTDWKPAKITFDDKMFAPFDALRERLCSGNAPIILDGSQYQHGLTITGSAVIEYKLPESLATFQAVLGIEEQYRPLSASSVSIFADSQLLGMWDLRGDKIAERIRVTLPPNASVFRVEVKPLAGLAVPTIATFAEAKFGLAQ